MKRNFATSWLVGASLSLLAAIPADAASCVSLGTLKLLHTTITNAQVVGAGAFVSQGRGPNSPAAFGALPAFCRIAATLEPVADSHIQIEVWLPASGWNGKLQSVGNGAWAGTLSYPAMASALAAGYATASTDTGHTGTSGSFVFGHPAKMVDFAYRSVHEMTVAAKAIAKAFYGNGPKYSYWNGCSTGGRQAMAEVQRYPNDYDGVIAGAPAINASRLQAMQVWAGQQAALNEGGSLPLGKTIALHNFALAACDALDGVKDGVIEDPTRCHFDPKTTACKDEDGPFCLTSPQLQLAEKIYAGPKNPRTGEAVFPGLETGSELGWNGLIGKQPMSLAVEMYQFMVHKDPTWDYKTFDPDKDVALAVKTIGAAMDANDPNLQPFFSHGGKLLMYHGWADPGIAPRNSVTYYQSVVDTLGGPTKTADSVRLFMVPGMGHCRGGDGTDTFDPVGPLDQWVEKDQAPDQIVASRIRNGAADRTRPLCPYPQIALYKGTGSTNDAANFACIAGK